MRRSSFGTDGVRGRANDELTPEVAARLRPRRRPRPRRPSAARRPRHAPQQRDAGRGGLRRRGLGGRRRRRPRRAADARRRRALRPRRRRRGRRLGLAQPLRRQRAQGPRRAAARSSTWRSSRRSSATSPLRAAPHDRGPPDRARRRARSRVDDAAHAGTSRGCCSAADDDVARRPARRRRLRERRGERHRAGGASAPLGATVTTIGDEPDGCNINDKVGSTAPAGARRRRGGAPARTSASPRRGRRPVHRGRRRRAACSTATGCSRCSPPSARAAGTLGGGVVVTVMSNLGLHHAMRDAGIEVVEVPVGDRHVAEALERTGWPLGGEQSGHVVFADRATTGDGDADGAAARPARRRARTARTR